MVLLSVTNISAVEKAMFALIPSFNPSQRMSVLELSDLVKALEDKFGISYYERSDAPATSQQKAKLKKLSPDDISSKTLAGEEIVDIFACSVFKNRIFFIFAHIFCDCQFFACHIIKTLSDYDSF
jgi:hypothetical protein